MTDSRTDKNGNTIPSKKKIINYWKKAHENLKSSLNKDIESGECCWACGYKDTVHRAHIAPHHDGGSMNPSNFHLLCQTCHSISEGLHGYDYWLWISLKSLLYDEGCDMTVEWDIDVDDNSKLRKYMYPSEYPDKLKKFEREYTELSLLEGHWDRKLSSYYYLKNQHIRTLSINYPDLRLLDEILEYTNAKKEYYELLEENKKRWEVIK
jgi:hypothetical protein